MGLIDIHTHIIYGVDDGAKDIEESIALLHEEKRQGVDKILLTPHYGPKFGHPDKELLKEHFHMLCEKVEGYNLGIQLYLGSELYYQQNTVKDLDKGKALTLNDTKYVLVEFGVQDPFSVIFQAVHELGYAGYIPVIAHVERYEAVFKKIKRAEELVDAGAYLQVNAESIPGGMFHPKASFVKKLMKEGLLHFVGSDCHNLETRRPDLDQAEKILLKRGAEEVLYDNPAALLEGKYI